MEESPNNGITGSDAADTIEAIFAYFEKKKQDDPVLWDLWQAICDESSGWRDRVSRLREADPQTVYDFLHENDRQAGSVGFVLHHLGDILDSDALDEKYQEIEDGTAKQLLNQLAELGFYPEYNVEKVQTRLTKEVRWYTSERSAFASPIEYEQVASIIEDIFSYFESKQQERPELWKALMKESSGWRDRVAGLREADPQTIHEFLIEEAGHSWGVGFILNYAGGVLDYDAHEQESQGVENSLARQLLNQLIRLGFYPHYELDAVATPFAVEAGYYTDLLYPPPPPPVIPSPTTSDSPRSNTTPYKNYRPGINAFEHWGDLMISADTLEAIRHAQSGTHFARAQKTLRILEKSKQYHEEPELIREESGEERLFIKIMPFGEHDSKHYFEQLWKACRTIEDIVNKPGPPAAGNPEHPSWRSRISGMFHRDRNSREK